MAIAYINSKELTSGIRIKAASPIDDRFVVDSIDGLTSLYNEQTNPKGIHHAYTGLVVNIKGTNDLYVLVGTPKQASAKDADGNPLYWKKVGSDGGIDTKDLGARTVTSVDGLDNLTFLYDGAFAVVKNPGDSSKDGLYVYDDTNKNWNLVVSSAPVAADAVAKRVDSLEEVGNVPEGTIVVVKGSESEGDGIYILTDKENNIWTPLGGDTTSNVTVDGSVPLGGDGIAIDKTPKDDVSVIETYIDAEHPMVSGEYYTSRGLNSYDKNGSGDDNEYIILDKGDMSYVKFNAINGSEDEYWIEINLQDDSLGFDESNISCIDEDGNAVSLDDIKNDDGIIQVPVGYSISFDKPIDFNGFNERRSDGGTYVFGESGSTYSDLDIFKSDVVPNVYVYTDGNPVRVLTEGDKNEIITIIEESVAPSVINDDDIARLFTNDDDFITK